MVMCMSYWYTLLVITYVATSLRPMFTAYVATVLHGVCCFVVLLHTVG